MRKLSVQAFVTLDGVMQAPGGPAEDPTGGFRQGGWSFGYWDEDMGRIMGDAMAQPADLLLGRKTYEIFAAHWPHAGDDPMARKLNDARKYVVSSVERPLAWKNSRLITGDVTGAIARLKREDGPELQVHGSTRLIQTLLTAGLIDELRLWIFPVVVGAGKRLFDQGTVPAGLAVVDSKTSSSGVLIVSYRPAGAIKSGSFQIDPPHADELARRERLARGG